MSRDTLHVRVPTATPSRGGSFRLRTPNKERTISIIFHKRKVAIVRKEDCKREKAKDETEDKSAAPETENKSATPETENKGAALVEEEPNEEAWNSLTISEIKKNTCNIKGIRIFLDVIFDRLYQ